VFDISNVKHRVRALAAKVTARKNVFPSPVSIDASVAKSDKKLVEKQEGMIMPLQENQ
jgi:hypothetical protein